jgi:hypothetical protein
MERKPIDRMMQDDGCTIISELIIKSKTMNGATISTVSISLLSPCQLRIAFVDAVLEIHRHIEYPAVNAGFSRSFPSSV